MPHTKEYLKNLRKYALAAANIIKKSDDGDLAARENFPAAKDYGIKSDDVLHIHWRMP
jgi:hypothetical protein